MGADYSFYVKVIETHVRTFLPLNISAIGTVFGSYLYKLDEIPKCDFKKSLDPLLRTMTCFELCNFTGAHHYIHNNHIAANCNGFHAQFIRRSIDSAHLQIKIFASGVGILKLVKYLTHQIQKPIPKFLSDQNFH